MEVVVEGAVGGTPAKVNKSVARLQAAWAPPPQLEALNRDGGGGNVTNVVMLKQWAAISFTFQTSETLDTDTY